MDDPHELYVFLKEHVPPISSSNMEAFMNNIENKREHLLRLHRIIALSPFLSTKHNLDGLVPPMHYLPSYVFRPIEVVPPKISPNILQQAAQLYQMIHQDITTFFEGFMKQKGTNNFYFMIHSSIPSLFGYFSSNEHIQLAFPFYMNAVQLKDRALAAEIMLPFFNIPAMYRFYESILFSVTDRLRSETRFNRENIMVSIISFYKNLMIESILTSLPLLTQPHSAILKMMIQYWDTRDFLGFLINALFWEFTQYWLESNSLSQILPIVRQIFDAIIDDANFRTKLIQKIQATSTDILIPNIYLPFNCTYLLYITSNSDLLAILNAYSQVKQLPNRITNIKNEITNNFLLYFIKVYWRRNVPQNQVFRPLVFTPSPLKYEEVSEYERIFLHLESNATDPYSHIINAKEFAFADDKLKNYILYRTDKMLISQSQDFEKLMDFQLYSKFMDEWTEIAQSYVRLRVSQIADIAVTLSFNRKYKYMNFAFSKASTMFTGRIINLTQYLLLAQLYARKFMKQFEKEEQKISNWWISMLESKNNNLDDLGTSFTTKAANNLFWESVELLRSISIENYQVAFRTLMRAVHNIIQISTINNKNVDILTKSSLLEKAIIISKPTQLINIHLTIGPLCMDNLLFKDFCTVTEQESWVIFDATIYTLTIQNQEIYEMISRIQEYLRNIEKDGDDTIVE